MARQQWETVCRMRQQFRAGTHHIDSALNPLPIPSAVRLIQRGHARTRQIMVAIDNANRHKPVRHHTPHPVPQAQRLIPVTPPHGKMQYHRAGTIPDILHGNIMQPVTSTASRRTRHQIRCLKPTLDTSLQQEHHGRGTRTTLKMNGLHARRGQLHKTDINQKEPLPCQRVNVIALLIRLDCIICALDARSSFARTTFVGMLNVVLFTTVEPNPTLPVTLPPFA